MEEGNKVVMKAFEWLLMNQLKWPLYYHITGTGLKSLVLYMDLQNYMGWPNMRSLYHIVV